MNPGMDGDAMSGASGRRDYDEREFTYLEERMKGWVEREIRATRHALRSEISAVATRVDAMALVSTREHGEVKARLDRVQAGLHDTLKALGPMVERVAVLERSDAAEQAVGAATDHLRTSLRATAGVLMAVIR